jgi:catechol 2,3-dioxygenase-like lactoylglutathione lyase family enzyme
MLKVDHIVFPTWNAKASLKFYRDVMGFALISAFSGPDWGGYPWLMMIFSPGDGREIVLVALKGAKKPKPDGLAKDTRHLAFGEKSVAALAKWRKKLKSAKIAFWEESHGAQKSLYFEDPNGMILEVTAPPSRAKGKTGKAALAHAEQWMAA